IFEDGTAVDVECTIGNVEAVAAIDNVGGTFDIKAAATVNDDNDIGSFAAIVVSDIIGIFDLVSVASFDDMGVGAFDNVGIGAFENTVDLMFL
ncbi:46406_t:CDS:2, partial [Gigaspora margarita]